MNLAFLGFLETGIVKSPPPPSISSSFISIYFVILKGYGGFRLIQAVYTVCKMNLRTRTYTQIHTPTVVWVVALLEACDVTNNGRHVGFFQELEIRLKPREMVIF